MLINVIVKFSFEGLHRWKNAPETSYLKYPHRHIFYVTAKKRVSHTDRDIEFIDFKHQMQSYCEDLSLDNLGSCEKIAEELLIAFECCYVSVFEDNENGAEVINE